MYMFSIFWILVVIAVPLLVVIGGIVLFNRTSSLQADVNLLKQILYKQTTHAGQSQSQPTAQPAVQLEAKPTVQQSVPVDTFQQTLQANKGGITEEAGGRWLGNLGILAIILGVSFFLKDAFANNWIGPGGRVLIGILGGAILLIVGQYIRAKYKNYSDLLIGGSYGVFYLTTFGAFYFYHLISAPVAYIFFVAITALAVIMSIVDKSSLLAHIGVIGGFLAPILLAGLNPKTAGALAQLLAYILILDLGVVAVSYVYKWKSLSFVAFVGTIFSYLFTLDYYFKPEMRMTALVFITLYFLVFMFVSVSHHLVRKEKSDTSDIFLITLNALQYGVLGAALVDKIAPNFLGFFCIVVALIYFVVAAVAWRTAKDDMLLNLYLPGIATVFLTVAIPAQLDGKSVLIAWLVEALVIVWISYKTAIKNLMYGGFVVFLVAMIKFGVEFGGNSAIWNRLGSYGNELKQINDYVFLFNTQMMYVALITITGALVAWSLYIAWKKWGMGHLGVLAAILFVVVNVFLLGSIIGEINTSYEVAAHNSAVRKAEAKFAEQGYKDLEEYQFMDSGMITEDLMRRYYSEVYYEGYRANQNQREMINSIIMALYASLLLVGGFAKNSKFVRICGLVLIFITAIYIFLSIWDLGSVYRIITALIFGIIALLGSFGYARFSRAANNQTNNQVSN